jgi:hypothetical protein
MSKVLITFCSGNKDYYDAGNRLINQGKETELFNKTIQYTDYYLKNDKEFWNQHSNFIENNKKGYGYWIWKPYIIKKTIENMKNDDILLYLDCGCEIDIRKKNIISEYFEIVKRDHIVCAFTFHEKEWTKMDLLIELEAVDDRYLNTCQHQAGAILFLISDKTRILINKWYELSCDYHLIDDSESINTNLDCFKEHRHDQSIFSLLTKKYNLYSHHSIEYAIDYIRNISGISKF